MVRVSANGQRELGSILSRIILKTKKMALDISLLDPQHYKVRLRDKAEQSKENSRASRTPPCRSY